MPLKIRRFRLWFHYEMPARELVIDYMPITIKENGNEEEVPQYHAQFRLGYNDLPEALKRKLARLVEYAESQLAAPEIEIDGSTTRGAPRLWYLQVIPHRFGDLFPRTRRLHVTYYMSSQDQNVAEEDVALTDAAERLIDNIYPMCEQLAWGNLRKRLGNEAKPAVNPKRKVFISYRKGRAERQRFVEAIAHRLGREGFLPWFDEWEIKAGDSIARELAAGFEDVYGIVIVLGADYPGGRWAREEMETAITKRTEENIRVIPVLYEDGDRPELLRSLRYVDCRDHSEGSFERQFSDIIDALNEIELNPYR